MPECDYCERTFADEDAYLAHLAAEHYEELGRIDHRRVDEFHDAQETLQVPMPLLAIIVGGLLIVSLAYILVPLVGTNSETSAGPKGSQPSALGSVHYHGPIEMQVDGHRVDFSRSKYQHADRYFHFEHGNGRRWHVHGKGVTLQYGLNTLPGIHIANGTVTYDGTTYRDRTPGVSVTITVNGQSVDPATYQLRKGDRIRINVTTNSTRSDHTRTAK